ncbi:MAG: hypothetical protein BWY72_01077 [Bacteroidetes bacterium ADurb.Bin416]|nr:MAG: hypothetical protein BWY72_01077 [Bacteroidetes bacterium ADurb.Bin416]
MKRSFHPIVPFLLSSLLLFGAPVAGLYNQAATAQSSAVMQMASGEWFLRIKLMDLWLHKDRDASASMG